MGVRANVWENSSATSAASVVESTPEVGRISDGDNQPSASLSTEKANSSSLQDDFQISEPKVKRIKSTESTQLNSIQTFLLTQGLLSVEALTYECDIGLWQDLTEEMHDYWCMKGSNDCLNETASIHNSIQIDGKQKKIFSQVNVLLFSAKWEKEGEKIGSIIPQLQAKHFASNASCFHQKTVLSPEVASATGKMPHSKWWLMRAVKPTGVLP